ncbi:hypothetical protein SLA2020_067930 [Shorea laevis]
MSDAVEEERMSNPLKLPMGWVLTDTLYWLFKLHGFNREFKCEICGGYSYMGRRALERYFKELRYQHGMRCLGIPNTKDFYEIISIEEAQALWKKMEHRKRRKEWNSILKNAKTKRVIYILKGHSNLQRQVLL